MQSSSKIKTAFMAGHQTFGMWQMMPGANVSRTLARTGVDWVCVDCEHGNIDGIPSLPLPVQVESCQLTGHEQMGRCMTLFLQSLRLVCRPLSESRTCNPGW